MMFKNYKVLVVGATSGIGLATAKLFLNQGAKVIGVGRSFDKTAGLGENFIPCKCDINDVEQIKSTVDFVTRVFEGTLDTYIHVAGLGQTALVTTMEPEQFDESFHLLLRPVMIFGKSLYDLLIKAENKNPSMVTISSAGSRSFQSSFLLYGIPKSAVIQYTKMAATGFEGVRCNSVSPGYVNTPIFGRKGTDFKDDFKDGLFKQMEQILPLGRISEPEEVADLVAFLASEDATYINGADVLIDGGLSLVTP